MMTPAQAEQLLFEDTLSCTLTTVCGLVPGSQPALDGAEMRLRAVAMVEDGRTEDSEDRQDKTLALQRIEAKLDLVLALCGQLLGARTGSGDAHDFRLSARGVALDLPAGTALPAADAPLTFNFQAADWLPDAVNLPVRVLATETTGATTRLWLAFDGLGSVLQDLLQRHVFRLHRRGIAQQRQSHR